MPILGLAPYKTSFGKHHPQHFDIESVIRPNILALQPYRCARDDYQEGILLDANENSLGHSIPRAFNELNGSSANGHAGPPLQDLDLDADLHRYPDPSHDEIKNRIAKLRGVPNRDYVFLGVGSDEVIDLLIRVCCAPQDEKILITPPTYGMYSVCANVNDVPIVKIPLDVEKGRFLPRVDEIRAATKADPAIKLIFICSPGNPTSTLIPLEAVTEILDEPSFKGIVIVDEAYIDFAASDASAVTLVAKYANLVVLQTLSKSFGLAAIRIGVAIAQPPLIQILTNTKAPYNVSAPSAALALRALSPEGLDLMRQKVATLNASKANLLASLSRARFKDLGVADVIGGSHANFIMLPILDGKDGEPDSGRAQQIYKRMAEECKVVIRYRGGDYGCTGCLRFTVGSEEENKVLLEKFEDCLRVIGSSKILDVA